MGSDRIISVDAFRGFTIIGMIMANTMFVCRTFGQYSCYSVLLHEQWHGATFADLVFPFFLFIVGVSVVLSYSKKIPCPGHNPRLLLRATWRAIKLFLLGIVVNVLMAGGEGSISMMGVLQRIALVYLACVLLYLFSRWRTQLVVGAFVLVSYWLAMAFIPVPSVGTGILEPGTNLAAWIDQIIQPGALNMGTWDTEGLFSTIPAIGTGITGMLAGHLLISTLTVEKKVIGLFLGGFVSMVLGQLWGLSFPINKSLWTSSFVLYTSGWACVTLASFTWLSDIAAFRKWSRICIVLGRKSLFCYIVHLVLLGAGLFPLFGK
jgi:predicted acyltransferase